MDDKKINDEKLEGKKRFCPKDLTFKSYVKSCFGDNAIKILGGTFLAGFVWSRYRTWKAKCKNTCDL